MDVMEPNIEPMETPKRRWVLKTIAGLALLIVGMGIGSASQPVAAEAPVVSYLTPASCLEALDLAAEGLEHAGTFAEIAQVAVNAAALRDVEGINLATAMIEANTEKIVALQEPTRTASQDCRSKA